MIDWKSTDIPGVKLLQSKVFRDARGQFLESFNRRDLACAGINYRFVQDNVSTSVKNVVRGLHYQVRHVQGKFVRALFGTVFDVVVDIRPESPTFGKHTGIFLDADEGNAIWIPPGLAHGFCVTSELAILQYKVTHYYAPKYERSLRWEDPDLGIRWPLSGPPIVSEKDSTGHPFSDMEYQLLSKAS